MEFFLPPSDNLYKFVALSGVLLVILCPYYLFRFSLDLNSRQSAALQETIKMVNEDSFLREDLQDLKNRILNEPDDGRTDTFLKLKKEVLTELEGRKDKSRELLNSAYRLRVTMRDIEYLYKLRTYLWWFCLPGILIGILLSIWGFRCWYYRVQVPLDLALKEKSVKNKN